MNQQCRRCPLDSSGSVCVDRIRPALPGLSSSPSTSAEAATQCSSNCQQRCRHRISTSDAIEVYRQTNAPKQAIGIITRSFGQWSSALDPSPANSPATRCASFCPTFVGSPCRLRFLFSSNSVALFAFCQDLEIIGERGIKGFNVWETESDRDKRQGLCCESNATTNVLHFFSRKRKNCKRYYPHYTLVHL